MRKIVRIIPITEVTFSFIEVENNISGFNEQSFRTDSVASLSNEENFAELLGDLSIKECQAGLIKHYNKPLIVKSATVHKHRYEMTVEAFTEFATKIY